MERDFVIVLSYIRTLEERLQIKSWRILLSSERADEVRPPVSGGGSGNVRQQEAGRICYDDLSYSRIVDIIANLLRY